MKPDKILSLVGLATRAGKTASGEFCTEKEVDVYKRQATESLPTARAATHQNARYLLWREILPEDLQRQQETVCIRQSCRSGEMCIRDRWICSASSDSGAGRKNA